MPDVTVVVPTRDREPLLSSALQAALRQRDADLEVVVVDDGSGDGTPELVTSWGDSRLRLARHDAPRGVSAARNTGIAAARGEWVAFLDDDDLWAPDKLAQQLSAARANRRPWVYAGDVTVDAALRVVAGAPPPDPPAVMAALPRHNAVPAGCSNVVVHREVLADVGGFDPALTNNEDWDMWLRLARWGPPAWVAAPLVAVRTHPGNATQNMPRMLAELRVIARRHGVPVDWVRHYRWAGWTRMAEGRRGRAAGYYLRAVAAGDVRSLGRAAVALARPGVATGRVAGDSPWVDAAREWLTEFDAVEPQATAS